MPIDTVVVDVGEATSEPTVAGGERVIEDFVILLVPVYFIGLLSPELIPGGRIERELAMVVVRLDDVKVLGGEMGRGDVSERGGSLGF